MSATVIILGGGIAGLSAAHELIERGFGVEVYEALQIPGGKARSIPVAGTGTHGRRDLPGEHGFRFFPRFYRHVTDTMRRIPYGHHGTVADNLIDTTRCQLTRYGRHPIEVTARSPRSIADMRVLLDDLGRFLGGDLGLSHDDLAFFVTRVWQIVTSCRDRRAQEYEQIAWWDFIGAEHRSLAYQKLLGHGITRSLVAAKADKASTKTIGDIFVQLLFDIISPGPSTDRVLNGPTNDVWIDPWVEYLTARGLRYHYGARARAVTFADGRIREATIEQGGGRSQVAADYFVFALPVEDVIDLITPQMITAEPALGALFTLDDITEWMNGIQIYLTEDVPITHGHTIYIDSPWAITSISQAQFWKNVNLSEFGDGNVRGIISVDISEWDQKGLNGKSARECTNEEIKIEVWEQLKRSLNYGDRVLLRDEHLHHWSLDPALKWGADSRISNEEPLLVNLVDTWKLRPEAVTAIPNLFLASDYVRTFTDLATMEAANEAARRAVNGILDHSRSLAPRCEVWELYEPELLMPWREFDRIRFAHGLPWDDALVKIGLSVQELLDKAITSLERSTEQHNLFSGRGEGLHFLEHEFVAAFERDAPGRISSELRRDAVSLVERIGHLVAQRLAEGHSASRMAGSSSPPSRSARGGRVTILPR